ncbi:efflux transporter outer membrane subunit [Rivibacter subsaxonicus]|uniref:Multidrug efflux system outer membrane protein n=1 Tax=Rivibacter subsaxonicus TaxID=457575 RepID=A0A4Q7VNL7_9BURK|nr:efflux transporter outer membrane subunit [Rivibacter subsaxonicus]RZT97912.1 multidrug efflux system outer membrane protein [Rivibacter subsaxonicus]
MKTIRASGSRWVLLAAAVATAGCMLGPDYKRPLLEVPDRYYYASSEARELANTAWWTQFGDPVLDALIEEGLRNNLDLRIAAARVDQFAGVLGSTRAQLFPQVGAELTGSRTRASERSATGFPPGNPYNAVQADVFASWEIDLFGRLRRLNEAAQAELLASEEGRRATVLSLVAAIANGYVTLRALDRQLEISRATLKSRGESLEVFEKRFKGGVISHLELEQSRSEYATALAAVPDLERQVAQQENALAVLVGRGPGPVARGATIDALVLPAVPAGLPSELLERRPDVLGAEQALVAANARIGAAKALYFPSISLTGLFGGASTSLSGLFDGPARVWTYGAAITAPVFTAGSIKGQVQSAEAAEQQALYGYQRAVQTAFQEAEDALVGQARYRERLAAQQLQVKALRNYARLARARYEGGYSSFLEVLDAERSLFSAELDFTRGQAAIQAQMIGLYKALGGGWVDTAGALAGGASAPMR